MAQYIANVCERYQIVDKIQLNTDVKELRWIEDDEEWEVTLLHLVPGTGDLTQHERDRIAAQDGHHKVYVKAEIVRAKVIVSGVGGLVEPKAWPNDIPGIKNFEGETMHSARWNDQIDLEDKNVIVVGSGCSAAQVVPELAKPEANVRSITQLMRTPPWVEPDTIPPDYIPLYEKWIPGLMTHVPGLASSMRKALFIKLEKAFYDIFMDTAWSRRARPQLEKEYLDNMRQVAPKEYHEILTPNYSLGCKRRVFCGTWYRSLNAPNVELTTQPLTSVHAKSVVLGPGRHYPPLKSEDADEIREIPADVIIMANGFETNQWLHPLKVIGRKGKNLEEVWAERGGAQAYQGIAMDSFPNFFILFGPNTATGHNSVIFATENAVNYSLKFIKPILNGQVSSYEVKEDAEREWTQQVQDALRKSVFHRGTCSSWYISADGWNSSTYPFTQIHYWLRCKFPVWRHWTANLTRKGRVLRVLRKVLQGLVILWLIAGVMASESSQFEISPPQTESGNQSIGASDSNKRKAEQGNGTQARTKRNRYISIACEFRSMTDQITTLQDQVNSLFTNLNDLRAQRPTFDSPGFERLSRNGSQSAYTPMQAGLAKPRARHPRFHGPTSSAFNFDVAKSSLQNMGITPTEEGTPDDLNTAHVSPAGSPSANLGQLLPTTHPTKDPIWTIPREEAMRLCKVYEEEVGIMYPVVDITKVISQANLLYTFMEAATRTGFAQRGFPGSDGLYDESSIILKLILATTLVVEGSGQSELGQRLYLDVKPSIESKLWESHTIKTIQLFAIVATYHYHTDDDAMAYRLIGLAARMCLAMGLHRRDALVKSFPVEQQWNEVTRLFWSVYSLDRRWSLGTGLPFVIQDEDIDPNLPEPDASLPYLRCMVLYNRISSKIWYSGLGSEGTTDIRRDEIGYLDYQILQWYKQVPDELKFHPVETLKNGETLSRGMRRLRVLLYLRMNQLRILIYRPVLHSPASIAEDRGHAQTVVEVAKDSVHVLTRLNQMSDIYRTQQITFNYFLVAALAVLFLAVSHAPVEFNRQVRDEFYMALDLVNGFSTKSFVSKRLWKTIKGLRKIGEKLGVIARPFGPDSSDPHSSAAVAMAGLAGHPIQDLSMYGPMNGGNELGNSPLNGLQMSQELTNLFEAVGAFGNFMPNSSSDGISGYVGPDGEIQNTGEGLSGVLGDEGEFARVIRDLF
ncbi:Fungal specific transcription factor, putative [Penicillium digitatum PHI26]|uniref:Fungal specific transcription factor, putative n=2 Tax=Penicillium digitatum TaxID=36651 RepID=K9F886_PEND2|nr:Fungal specific transcription factor, putative [Penicillium digitatum Pd1]EKV05309.1 Fungal specific transcription factor, putative [Penicillium digitatum PHI26]EKV19808.1 Fungal specific transcription factor, putative [Penicillium digitatum Pd1]